MSRPAAWIVILLAVQIALSSVAAGIELLSSCSACGAGRLGPALLGLLGYGVLLVRARTTGVGPEVCLGILFAGGVHATLVIHMAMVHAWCAVCVCAATVSAVLTVVVLRLDRSNLGRLALVTPVAALVVMVGGAATVPAAAGTAPDGRIAILVYGQPDCGYCEELRTTVLPAIEREFGARIRVEHHSAMDLPAVRRTPTLVLSSGRSAGAVRVIEGLPRLERLRGAIRDLEASP